MNVEFQSESLGRDLRALRKSRGLTLAQVAEALDRSVGWMSQVERDLSEPDRTEVKALADVFGVSVSTLFGWVPAKAVEAGVGVRRDARRPVAKREV